jgi:hypothetical protein
MLGAVKRALFGRGGAGKLDGSPVGGHRMRRRIVGLLTVLALVGLGLSVYAKFFYAPPLLARQQHHQDDHKPLPKADEFEELVRTDPLTMYDKCLTRYKREVKGGMRATLVKRERVKGEPKPPADPQEEVISIAVRGDVPDETGKVCPEVVMKWQSGARRSFLGEIRGTFYSERPPPEGTGKKVLVKLPISTITTSPNTQLAQTQSRYCICDAGLLGAMTRTYSAWKQRKEAGTLKVEYLGKRVVEQTGGRLCHIVKRTCGGLEVDPFQIDGKADLSPENIEKSGFTSVTVMIDVERWIQVGSELVRTGPDGRDTLIASYYFRDVELNPPFEPDTFSEAGLKK